MRPGRLVPSGPGAPLSSAAALDALLVEARRALAGDGRVVFLLGPAGCGKSRLLRELRTSLQAAPSAPTVVSEVCADDERDVWLRIAHAAARRRRLKRAAVSVLPDWLGLVPVAGNFLAALSATVVALAHRSGSEEPANVASAPAAVRDLLARTAGGLVVLLDRGEAADTPDLAGIAALVRHLRGRSILLVVAVAPGGGTATTALRDLMLEAERVGRGRRVLLASDDTRATLPDGTAPSALAEDDARLLATAARQGPVFRALRLARDAGVPELEVEERLSRLTRHGILEHRGVQPDEQGELTGVYAFQSDVVPERVGDP